MSYSRDLSFIYYNPTKIIFGEGSIKEIGIEAEALGGTRAVVVTDRGVVEAGLAGEVEEALGRKYVGTFDGAVQDSGFHIVNEGAKFAREAGADTIVSVGGGSSIDTAKGISILLKEGGQMQDYSGFQLLSRPQTPHIAVPTTAGTGSEVTYAAVVKDWENNEKILFCDNHIIPRVAILDPLLTAGLPPPLTASTGIDALTHAIEALHALQAEPIADAMALQAIRLITAYLPRCVANGDDLFARGQQQIAALMAGVAFSNAQLGLVHAMAHSLGALFNVPHGLANSLLLPHVMLYNLESCAERYLLVAEAMGLATAGLDEEGAARLAVNAVQELTRKIGLPQRLREAGVPEEGLAEAAELSLSDGSIIYNPRPVFEADEVLALFREAW
ncbi:MAG TPA: iron-containing alcohol dehydrogenase [Bacillota bacterium]|jgi:alcohol dehydrogenase class IV|nr:iron-containing alcohol dehydrogenase [Bacillota bacterium]HPZ42179.1 iron-containing alcohol dehydrogenase [Bacillota bacterium]HQD52999.1 iron-containing alcohol dehydrogenase [Bacillota bacterium]